MVEIQYKAVLITDFNAQNLSGYLANDLELPAISVISPPFGQVESVLLDAGAPCWQEKPDVAVVWTRPERMVDSFAHLLRREHGTELNILEGVDAFANQLVEMAKRVQVTLVPSWDIAGSRGAAGLLDFNMEWGLSRMLMRMNLRLAENLEASPNIYMLDTQQWIAAAGVDAFNPKLWYMAKVPYANDVFKRAVKSIKASINGIKGRARKLVVLDLDDTLWGGVVGDDGWENLKLGGHDFNGEAFVDFQRSLLNLKNGGVVLAIASKNDEQVALKAMENHPEMVLDRGDFGAWRINWTDKAQNIVDLVNELNLGLQSTVFIDDNPIERDRVREALPEVLVPEWPDDPMLYKTALLSLDCFDVPSISSEDRRRSKLYASERERQDLKKQLTSVDDWLQSLKMKVKVEHLAKHNLPRAAQLLNKTNQMNLSTRRMTDLELAQWTGQEGHYLWTFSVADKFGDSGLTGIVSISAEGERVVFVDFVLSCRVFARKIEEVMVHTALEHARSLGAKRLEAEYKPTEKNKPCLDFWEHSPFIQVEENFHFSLDLNAGLSLPAHIEIV